VGLSHCSERFGETEIAAEQPFGGSGSGFLPGRTYLQDQELVVKVYGPTEATFLTTSNRSHPIR
jgi:hypothetical protein